MDSSSPLTGSVPFSLMYASINRRSKMFPMLLLKRLGGESERVDRPDFLEATGCSGASPDTTKHISKERRWNGRSTHTCAEHFGQSLH